MAGKARREDLEAQAAVLRAVLLAGETGLTEDDLQEHCAALGWEAVDATAVEAATESLLASGLLERREDRLHPSGAATRFNRLRPL
jgi:hypothetical protein